jgi:hypothetical protein
MSQLEIVLMMILDPSVAALANFAVLACVRL